MRERLAADTVFCSPRHCSLASASLVMSCVGPGPLHPSPCPLLLQEDSHLEFHGCVLLILRGTPALVMQVVGGGGMDERGLLGLVPAVLAVQVHRQGQQPRAYEAGDACGHQVEETEPWEREETRGKERATVKTPNCPPIGGSET